MKKPDSCSICKYWERFDVGDYAGNCRRNPPVVDHYYSARLARERDSCDLDDDECFSTTICFWSQPVIEENGWCGEFVLRVDDK